MQRPTRRDLLRTGLYGAAGAFVGLGASSCSGGPAADPAPSASTAVRSDAPGPGAPPALRQLGATGLSVSEIGFGGFPIRDPQVLHYAIDRGITYVDTSDDYRGGASEETIGRVMKSRRREVVLATKWHPWARTRRDEMLRDLEGSLRRLQTDVVDVIQVHQVGKASGGEGVERLTNPELHEAFETARRQGKARFLGCTGHDGDLMDVMNAALDMGKFSTILCRYNFLDYPGQPALYRRARSAGTGTLAMKTLAGARKIDLSRYRAKGDGTTFAQAALRWALSNPDLSSAVISIVSRAQVDEYAAAPARAYGGTEASILNAYAAEHGSTVCRLCNACEPACPVGVPVADVLRYRMYARDYGLPEQARDLYARLAPARNAGACLTCAAPCAGHCPHGLDVGRLIAAAHIELHSRGPA